MRTITLLTALVLVALQAKAEPVPPTDEELPDQERTDAGDRVMAISFAEDETSALQDPGYPRKPPRLNCSCKRNCDPGKYIDGVCRRFPTKYYVCCPGRPPRRNGE